MASNFVLYESGDGVARVTLNRPDKLNCFSGEMHLELMRMLDRVQSDRSVRALLLTGAGRGFCSGQDLGARRAAGAEDAPDLGASLEAHYNPLIRRLSSLPIPVVCAVNGVAAGAGVSLALACDIVLAGRSARFIQSFARLGLVPDSGGTWALPRLVGQARALGLALLGDALDASTAAEWGLIWKVVDDSALIGEAERLSARLAAGPTAGLAATKRLIRESWTRGLDQALDLERDEMARLGRTSDYREAVEAFTGKRPPRFVGR